MAIKHTLYIVCCLLVGFAKAQSTKSATDYFNEASKHYVESKKIDALKTIEQGLQEHKNDKKLTELAEKILKEENQNQNQQQQQQNDKKDKDQEQKDKDKNKEQENKDKKDDGSQKQQPQSGMNKNQALQDLKALENKEKQLLKKINLKKEQGTPTKTDKDW
jgi:hypothetical protein